MALFERRSPLQRSYDKIADAYARQFHDELSHQPGERGLLDSFAEAVVDSGPCVDLGCGPGHVTRYLHERGVDIHGIDVSNAMVKRARALNPGIRFERGDLSRLKHKDNHWAAAVAFYSLVHLSPRELVPALLEIHRVLEPGGALLLGFHTDRIDATTDHEHLDHWLDQEVDLDFYFYRILHMLVNLEHAGFAQVSSYRRGPMDGREEQTGRAYILAEALPEIPPARRGPSLAGLATIGA